LLFFLCFLFFFKYILNNKQFFINFFKFFCNFFFSKFFKHPESDVYEIEKKGKQKQ
jgi:hypothetical protein